MSSRKPTDGYAHPPNQAEEAPEDSQPPLSEKRFILSTLQCYNSTWVLFCLRLVTPTLMLKLFEYDLIHFSELPHTAVIVKKKENEIIFFLSAYITSSTDWDDIISQDKQQWKIQIW